ncbi:MAG: DUF3052 domain-containing protein [Pseudomonadota bacterium]
MPTGYSGKPTWAKLGLKEGLRCLPLNAPGDYLALVDQPEGVSIVMTGPAEVVHLFCADISVLEREGVAALDSVAEGGMLWISWPKKSSKLFIDLTEDDLRRVMLPTGWVDVKVCAVSADWSGLKFLRRKR